MGRFQLILLAVALASPVFSRPNSYESSEEEFGLGLFDSAEGSFEDSEEIPLISYNPSKDGPADPFIDKWKASLGPGAMIPNEEQMRASWRKMYQDTLGQPLPAVTAADMQKMDKKLNDVELARTNELRAQHGAEPLVFDAQLAAYAKNYAEKISNQMSQGVPFQHNPENKIYRTGENMAQYGGPEAYQAKSTNMWFAEIDIYHKNGNHPVPTGVEPATGHFTQVVWKGTKKMGCGSGNVKGGSIVTICNYYPAGNMQGKSQSETYQNYDENVVA